LPEFGWHSGRVHVCAVLALRLLNVHAVGGSNEVRGVALVAKTWLDSLSGALLAERREGGCGDGDGKADCVG